MTAHRTRRKIIPSLMALIRKYQLTVINSSVTVILIGIVIFVLLNRASALQRQTSEESMVNLAGMAANEVQAYYTTYYDITRTLAQLLGDYRKIENSQRRGFVNDIMRSIISSSRYLVNVYSVWQPDILDGMDAEYSGQLGYDENGQFISGFTRERGFVEQKSFSEYKYLLEMDFLALGLLNGMVSEPILRTYAQQEIWSIDIQVPITYGTTLGVIGVTVNLEHLQFLVESTKSYRTENTMVVTGSGKIFAHSDAQFRGINFLSSSTWNQMFFGPETLQAFQAILDSINTNEPSVFRTEDTLLVSFPMKTTSGFFSFGETGRAPWAVVTMVPMATVLEPISTLLRFSIVFVAGAGALAAFVFFLSSSSLTQQARQLRRSLEQASIMQDNSKYGLFLINDKFMIQGAYSKALEKILAVSSLQDKNFIELLKASLKKQEREGFADYLQMILNSSFDEKMLEGVNPINEFTYYSTETEEKKNLRTSFKLAGGIGASFILGTIEDITAEKELQKQISEVENQVEKEKNSIFEVLQLNPRVLSDFIEDAEFEFSAINEVLKREEHITREGMFLLYQSIHSVKSNALILNLENFSAMLHKLENSIKTLQEKNDGAIPFDDLLILVLEIDEALKEIDYLKASISKIENFRKMYGESGSQEMYVLVETLTRVCSKTQASLDKKVRLVVEDIDEVVLDHGPRRVIKEVLTQLVRNSVYHGIETPAERVPLGKEPEGELRLSIKYRDGQIVIKFTDNGRGIDFDQVKQKAMASKMFRNPSDANDKSQLLKVIFAPGFSTLENANLYGGRGVGLSLVKDRIKDLFGNIAISTAPGRGTTFTISIPMELPVFANKAS